MTLSITTLCRAIKNTKQNVIYFLVVLYKHIMLSVAVLGVIFLRVIILSLVRPNVWGGTERYFNSTGHRKMLDKRIVG